MPRTARKYVRSAPEPVSLPAATSTEDVYTEIRAVVQRRLNMLHVEEQQLTEVLSSIGGRAPIEDLTNNGGTAKPRHQKVSVAVAADNPVKKRKPMTPAARKKASERMKAYWASKKQ